MRQCTFSIIALIMLVTACMTEPETIIQTVEVLSTVEVPVTQEVTRQLEVTRLQEVTREVIKEVEVTREVPLEVSRIVEIVVTATPEPTPLPTATTTPPAEPITEPAAPAGVADSLLQAARNLYKYNQDIRGQIHTSGSGDCGVIISIYEQTLAAPTFDVSSEPAEVQYACGEYLYSLEVFKDAVDDLDDGCRNAIANNENFGIPFLLWSVTMDLLNESMSAVGRSIETLENLS